MLSESARALGSFIFGVTCRDRSDPCFLLILQTQTYIQQPLEKVFGLFQSRYHGGKNDTNSEWFRQRLHSGIRDARAGVLRKLAGEGISANIAGLNDEFIKSQMVQLIDENAFEISDELKVFVFDLLKKI